MNAYEKENAPPGRHIPKSLAPLVANWEFDPPSGLITNRDIGKLAAVSEDQARVIASRLTKEGWLERVSRGHYRFVPAAMVYPRPAPWPLLAASRMPHLLSGLTAARVHRLTSQIPTRHLVIFSREKTPPQEVAKSPAFRVVRFRPDRIFGGEPKDMDGTIVTVARLERVMIDAAMHPDWVDGTEEMARILRRGFARADQKTLVEFIRRYGSAWLARRMGFWGDAFLDKGWPPKQRQQLVRILGPSPGGTLVPGARGSRQLDPQWGIYVNVLPELIEQADRIL